MIVPHASLASRPCAIQIKIFGAKNNRHVLHRVAAFSAQPSIICKSDTSDQSRSQNITSRTDHQYMLLTSGASSESSLASPLIPMVGAYWRKNNEAPCYCVACERAAALTEPSRPAGLHYFLFVVIEASKRVIASWWVLVHVRVKETRAEDMLGYARTQA